MSVRKTGGLSKAVLEMKFMKKTRERLEKAEADAAAAKEAVGEGGLYASELTPAMKRGMQTFTEDSLAACLNLLDGRRSYRGMNPEIERLTRLEENPDETPIDETDVTDTQMVQFYNPLVNTMKNKFNKTNKHNGSPPTTKNQQKSSKKNADNPQPPKNFISSNINKFNKFNKSKQKNKVGKRKKNN